MDFQKNRLWIAAAILLALGGVAAWQVSRNSGDSPVETSSDALTLPTVERDAIRTLEITRPDGGGETVRLVKDGETWRIAAPIEAPADQNAVSTAIDKLAELELRGSAAREARHHEQLEVDAAHAVHVVARGEGDAALIDAWIGAFRSGNTMLRLEGDDRVAMVEGSIKFAFNKDVRDWRDRSVVSVEADDVRDVSWVGPNGTFHFTRAEQAAAAPAEGAEAVPAGLGDWQIAEVSYLPPAPAAEAGAPAPRRPPPAPVPSTTIPDFAASKVRTVVSSLARMRATDFAAADVTAEVAGINDQSPRATLTLRDGTTRVLRLGNEASAERHDRYVQREGDPTVYVVSSFLGERISPQATAFQQTAPAAGAAPEGPPEGAMPPGMPGMPGGGQLPPEIMEQLRRQIEAQGGSMGQ